MARSSSTTTGAVALTNSAPNDEPDTGILRLTPTVAPAPTVTVRDGGDWERPLVAGISVTWTRTELRPGFETSTRPTRGT